MTCTDDVKKCSECFAGYRVWKGVNDDNLVACEACEKNCNKCTSNRK